MGKFTFDPKMKNKVRLTFGVLVGRFHNLGLKVVLVGKNVAFPLRHLLVLADPDVVCHLEYESLKMGLTDEVKFLYLVDEPEVVTDEYNSTLVVLDRIGQGVNGLHVQVVGRLVQEQHVWHLP